jgi:hypothetical protein
MSFEKWKTPSLALRTQLSDMLLNRGNGPPANALMLAVLGRTFFKGGLGARLSVLGTAGLMVFLKWSTQDFIKLIAIIKRNGLHEPSAGPTDILLNRLRMNEWLFEESQKAGDGATWAIGPALVVTSPANVKHILKDNFSNYIKGVELTASLEDLLGEGIFNSNGPKWKTQRKTGVKMFTRKKFGSFIQDVFVKHAETLWDQLAAKNGHTFDICDMYYKYTLDAICEVAFGVELHCLERDRVPFAEAFDSVQVLCSDRMLNPLLLIYPKRFNSGVKYLNPAEIKAVSDFKMVMWPLIDMRR